MGNMESWPDEYELLEIFEVEPVEANSSDGFWCYEKSYEDGTSLCFSFNVLIGSVQTDVIFMGKVLSSVCHEGVRSLSIFEEDGKKSLKADFKDGDFQRNLKVEIAPTCIVTWSTIKK